VRRLLLVVAAVLSVVLVAAGCDDGTVDESDVSGRGADVVLFVDPGATREQLQAVTARLDGEREDGVVERYEYLDEEAAREVAGVAARNEGGQVPAALSTLYLVWSNDAEATAALADRLGALEGIERVSVTDRPAGG